MEDHGLRGKSVPSNLHPYNRALFQSMMSFMDIVWEINTLTGTVVVLEDRGRPELNRMEFVYEDFFRYYLNNSIQEEDRRLFSARMSAEGLRSLREEVSLAIHTRSLDGAPEYYHLTLTPSFAQDGRLSCVYLCGRNIDAAANRELRRSNEQLRRTVSKEEQFRLATLSGSILNYNINLTRNLIEDEFYEIVDGVRYPMLELVGLKAPCDFDEFRKKWCQAKVPPDARENFLRFFNGAYFLDAYARGEKRLELEFDTVIGRGVPITLRSTTVLTRDEETGDILAQVSGKDVTAQRFEEHRQREALRQAYESANNANAAKSAFLARMSHDIRTPMNAVIGMTAIAQTHLDDRARVADCLNKIGAASQRLLGLLNEVLDMSKIESGKVSLQEEPFALSEMIDGLLAVARPQIDARGHKLHLLVRGIAHERVIGDSPRIQKCLMNLMSNAVKYTPEGGELRLTVTEKPTNKANLGCYEFILEDNGIGMSREFQKHLFEPFSRAQDGQVEKTQGAGLGLAIAKNIVQMMNGNIEVDSEPGQGTRFTVTIFLKLQQADAGEPGGEVPARPEDGAVPSTEVLARKDFSGCRVLLAEDNDLNAEIALELLSMAGLAVERARDGQEALELVSAAPEGYYDLVFMDIQMPVMNGRDATRAIRALERDDVKRLPILAMSANAFASDVLASKAAGMNDHIAKPLDFELLEEALEKWLGRGPRQG